MMTNKTDEEANEEAWETLSRFRSPDGNCLQCGQPGNRLPEVGPLWITLRMPEGEFSGGETFINCFCSWECLAHWFARQAGGVFVLDQD